MTLKLFGKNAIIYAIGSTGLRATGFLLIPIYTHFLSLNDYGLLATLLITINFMVTMIDLGLRSGLMRFVTEYTRENKLKYLLGSMVFINLTCGIVVSSIMYFFFQPLFVRILHTENVGGYIAIASLAAIVQSLSINITSYYRAINMGMKYMVMNLSVAGILIVFNFLLFILLDAGIQGAILAYIISYGSIGILVSLMIFPKTGIAISGSSLKQLFRFSAPLIFATGGFSIMDTTAAYFLSFFTNLETVGIYNLGYRLAQIAAMIIVVPFQLAYEPFLFANLDKPNIKEIVSRLTTYVVLAFAVVAFLTVFVFRDLITVIAPPEYYSAYYIIFLMLPGIAFSSLFYVGQSLVHVKTKTHVTGMTVALFSGLSVVLNYFLIQRFGLGGMVGVYNLVWISIALILMRAGLKAFPVDLEKKRLAIVACLFVFLLSIVYLIHDTSSYLYYTLIPAVVGLLFVTFYYGGFFDLNEKLMISKAAGKLSSILNLPKTQKTL